ncbi:MAG: T9SS type A sorting domain-containing protein [Bacteroidales bacterium]|nr:T9SS type A sorting domain-containing protein [Bacteroidales bacterium]
MKTSLKHQILASLLFITVSVQAQVSNYTLTDCPAPFEFMSSYDSLYTTLMFNGTYPYETRNAIYNGASNESIEDSLSGSGFEIGFPFYFDGDYYDRFAVSTNYYIKLGKSSEGNFSIYNEREKGSVFQDGYNNLRRNTIAAFVRTNIEDTIKSTYQIKSIVSGTPGNRALTVEWRSTRYPGPVSRYVFIKLLEKTGHVILTYFMDTMKYAKVTGSYPNYVYYPGDLPLMQASIGLRGNQPNNDMTNLNIMKVTKGVNTWTTFERGTSQTDFCDMDEHFMPAKNLAMNDNDTACVFWYKFTPIISSQALSSPYVYFCFIDKEYLVNNNYHYDKNIKDDKTGNTYASYNKLESSLFIFANGAKAIPINDATLHWNKAIGVDSFDVYFGLTYPPVLVASNITDTTYTPLENLAPGTTYYYSIVAKNSEGKSNKGVGSFTTSEAPISYCPDLIYDSGSYYDFTFNTLSYTRNAAYYEPFYMPESVYTTSVKRGENYSFSYTDYGGVVMTPYIYIDWNQDGDFTDTGERFQRSSTSGSTSLGSITIPSDAKLGKTNLRVYYYGAAAHGGPDPCGGDGIDQHPLQQYIISILPSEQCGSFHLDYAKTNTQCYGDSTGSITLNPVGGVEPYIYSWTDGNSNQIRTGLASGTYQATVTDANGCDQSTSVLAIQSPFLIQVDTLMVNDSLQLIVSGGTGDYTYTWTDTLGISVTQSNLPKAGTYTLTITDENACAVSYSNIVVPDTTVNALPIIKMASKTLQVYPNPTKGELTVSSADILDKITLVDLSGRSLLQKKNIGESKITLNISTLPTGIYLIKAYTINGIETNEIIKQ